MVNIHSVTRFKLDYCAYVTNISLDVLFSEVQVTVDLFDYVSVNFNGLPANF